MLELDPHMKSISILYIVPPSTSFFSSMPPISLQTNPFSHSLQLMGFSCGRTLFTTLTCDVTWVPQVEFMWTSLDQHVSIVGNTQEYSSYVCMRIQRFHCYVWTHHYHMSCSNLLYYIEFGF